MPSHDYLLSVKPSLRQWNDYLSEMSPGHRSAYVRTAIESYMEQCPVLRSIPLDLDRNPDEPMRQNPIQAVGTAAIEQWMSKVPFQFKSHLIRFILDWYRAKTLAETDPQPRFNLDEAGLQSTGTEP